MEILSNNAKSSWEDGIKTPLSYLTHFILTNSFYSSCQPSVKSSSNATFIISTLHFQREAGWEKCKGTEEEISVWFYREGTRLTSYPCNTAPFSHLLCQHYFYCIPHSRVSFFLWPLLMWNIWTVDRKVTEGRGRAGCDLRLADGLPTHIKRWMFEWGPLYAYDISEQHGRTYCTCKTLGHLVITKDFCLFVVFLLWNSASVTLTAGKVRSRCEGGRKDD